jgi:hypothetical protein
VSSWAAVGHWASCWWLLLPHALPDCPPLILPLLVLAKPTPGSEAVLAGPQKEERPFFFPRGFHQARWPQPHPATPEDPPGFTINQRHVHTLARGGGGHTFSGFNQPGWSEKVQARSQAVPGVMVTVSDPTEEAPPRLARPHSATILSTVSAGARQRDKVNT